MRLKYFFAKIVGGSWQIGSDTVNRTEGIVSVKRNLHVWPSQVDRWKFWNDTHWEEDPLLKVTGNSRLSN